MFIKQNDYNKHVLFLFNYKVFHLKIIKLFLFNDLFISSIVKIGIDFFRLEPSDLNMSGNGNEASRPFFKL